MPRPRGRRTPRLLRPGPFRRVVAVRTIGCVLASYGSSARAPGQSTSVVGLPATRLSGGACCPHEDLHRPMSHGSPPEAPLAGAAVVDRPTHPSSPCEGDGLPAPGLFAAGGNGVRPTTKERGGLPQTEKSTKQAEDSKDQDKSEQTKISHSEQKQREQANQLNPERKLKSKLRIREVPVQLSPSMPLACNTEEALETAAISAAIDIKSLGCALYSSTP